MPVSIHLTVLAEARSPVADGRWRTLNAWWREPDGENLKIDEDHDIFYGGETFDVMRERPALIVKLTPPCQWRESWPILLPKNVRQPGAIACAADGYAYLPVDAAYETYRFMDLCAGKYDEVMAPNFCTLQQLDDSTFEVEFRRPHYRDLKKVCNRIWKRAQKLAEEGRVTVNSKEDVRLVYWYFYVRHGMAEEEEEADKQTQKPQENDDDDDGSSSSSDSSSSADYSFIDEYNYGDLSLSLSSSSASVSSASYEEPVFSAEQEEEEQADVVSLDAKNPKECTEEVTEEETSDSEGSYEYEYETEGEYETETEGSYEYEYEYDTNDEENSESSTELDSSVESSEESSDETSDESSDESSEESSIESSDETSDESSEESSIESSDETSDESSEESSVESSDETNVEFRKISNRVHAELKRVIASHASLADQKTAVSAEFTHYFSEPFRFDDGEPLPDLIDGSRLCEPEEEQSDESSLTSSLPELIGTEEQEYQYRRFVAQVGLCPAEEGTFVESNETNETDEFIPLVSGNSTACYYEEEQNDMGDELDDILAEIERHVDHCDTMDVEDAVTADQYETYLTQPCAQQWGENTWNDKFCVYDALNDAMYTNESNEQSQFVAIDIPADYLSSYGATDTYHVQPLPDSERYTASFVDRPVVNTFEQQQTQTQYQQLNISETLLPVSFTYLFVGRDGEELRAGSEWLADTIQQQTSMPVDLHHIEAPLSEQDQLSIARRLSLDHSVCSRSMTLVRIRCNTTASDHSMIGFVHYLCTLDHVTVVLEYVGSLSTLIEQGHCAGHSMPWDFDYIVLCPSAPYPDVDASLSLMEVTEERRRERNFSGAQSGTNNENERHRRWLNLIAEMRPGDALLVPCNERETCVSVEEGTVVRRPLVLKEVFEKLKLE